MRPIILTITAFGPYATKQVIDFSTLQGRNLFVITGDTGAGKTTILDAISYALYGKASGRDRDGDSLRSHFAQVDVLTTVELEFELQGQRYWVQRIPKQRKKRTRGEGYTDQMPDAECKSLAEDGWVVSGVKEVNEKIVALLGLSYDQFKQIIMIPQGEFRELLNADSKARQDILQKIFGTAGLRRVQELFESQAKELVQDVSTLEEKRKECIRSLDGSGYLPLAESLGQDNYNVRAVVEAGQQAIAQDVAVGNELQGQINEQEQQVADKQGAIFQGKADQIKLVARDQAYERKVAMEAKLPSIEEKKRQLDQARKALALSGVDEYLANRTLNVQKKTAEMVGAEQQEKLAQIHAAAAEERYQQERTRDPIRTALTAEQLMLQGLGAKVTDWDVQQTSLLALKGQLRNTQLQRDNTKEQLEQIRLESTTCQLRLDEAKTATTVYGQKTIELEKMNNLYLKLEALQVESDRVLRLMEQVLVLEQQVSQHQRQYEQAQTNYEQGQHSFLEGQAGLLASALRAGEPCPVCGSAHHPKLGEMLATIPSEEELKQLREQHKQASELYDDSKSNYERKKGDCYAQGQILARFIKEVELIQGVSLGQLPPTELIKYSKQQGFEYQQTIHALQQELENLKKQELAATEIAATLTKNVAASNQATTKLATLEQQYTTVFAQVQSTTDAIGKLEGEIPVGVRSRKALAKELQRVEHELQILADAIQVADEERTRSQINYGIAVTEKNGADKALQEGMAECKLAEKKFTEALLRAGFREESEYKEAKLTEEKIASLGREISDYQEELRSVVDAYFLAQQGVEGLVPVDLILLERQYQELQTEKNKLITARTTILGRQSHNQTMLKSICELGEKIAGKEEEHVVIGHLAKIAKGDNDQKVSFERYVLAAFFNDIIDAANVRLKKMTGGRYQMSRITQKGKGSGQSGLEIEVFDYYTGQSRHVKTLSGGESFKASLALALGLAEVVQSYAGGISLETMFVDEGFGTLDPESLDTAIGCLIDLQHSGRLVGIISHVPELKANIDARLEIEAGKDGSNANFYIL